MRIRLDLAYDGTEFAGWQLQPAEPTIQGRLEGALRRFYHAAPDGGRRIAVTAAGRTDAGVHAEQQVVHFDAPGQVPPEGLQRGLNGLLPGSIRVLTAREVAPGFHARFDCNSKTYRYYLLPGKPASPLRSRFAWAVGDPLSIDAMRDAAAACVGRWDFRAFVTAPSGEPQRSPVRTVTEARFVRRGPFAVFQISAGGFGRYMVRRLVGTLVAVGQGRLPRSHLRDLLHDPDRVGPRHRAPAVGLRLFRVRYPSDDSERKQARQPRPGHGGE